MAINQGVFASLKRRTWLEAGLLAFFTVMGVSIVFVIGSIVLKAVHDHGLIPPPETSDTYTCGSGISRFTLRYSHGSDRVQIRSESGVLDGIVNQNRIEWLNFTNDVTQLGFLPPTNISFEDKGSIHVSSLDSHESLCAISAQHSGHRRQIAP
ncbi:MAG: hypothetical protein ABIZ09_04840 [Rhodoferax sp.]|jgi:hypothetical protein